MAPLAPIVDQVIAANAAQAVAAGTLVCGTVYKRGAEEVVPRLRG